MKNCATGRHSYFLKTRFCVSLLTSVCFDQSMASNPTITFPEYINNITLNAVEGINGTVQEVNSSGYISITPDGSFTIEGRNGTSYTSADITTVLGTPDENGVIAFTLLASNFGSPTVSGEYLLTITDNDENRSTQNVVFSMSNNAPTFGLTGGTTYISGFFCDPVLAGNIQTASVGTTPHYVPIESLSLVGINGNSYNSSNCGSLGTLDGSGIVKFSLTQADFGFPSVSSEYTLKATDKAGNYVTQKIILGMDYPTITFPSFVGIAAINGNGIDGWLQEIAVGLTPDYIPISALTLSGGGSSYVCTLGVEGNNGIVPFTLKTANLTPTIGSITAGNYTLTLTDKTGNSITKNLTVSPLPIFVDIPTIPVNPYLATVFGKIQESGTEGSYNPIVSLAIKASCSDEDLVYPSVNLPFTQNSSTGIASFTIPPDHSLIPDLASGVYEITAVDSLGNSRSTNLIVGRATVPGIDNTPPIINFVYPPTYVGASTCMIFGMADKPLQAALLMNASGQRAVPMEVLNSMNVQTQVQVTNRIKKYRETNFSTNAFANTLNSLNPSHIFVLPNPASMLTNGTWKVCVVDTFGNTRPLGPNSKELIVHNIPPELIIPTEPINFLDPNQSKNIILGKVISSIPMEDMRIDDTSLNLNQNSNEFHIPYLLTGPHTIRAIDGAENFTSKSLYVQNSPFLQTPSTPINPQLGIIKGQTNPGNTVVVGTLRNSRE